jgi:hypothetical protein
VLGALVRRGSSIELAGEPACKLNNVTCGLASLPSRYARKDGETIRIVVDFGRCEGYGLCEQTTPGVF